MIMITIINNEKSLSNELLKSSTVCSFIFCATFLLPNPTYAEESSEVNEEDQATESENTDGTIIVTASRTEMLINESSLPNSPQTVLGPWWEYPGCVATTGHPFILELADGHNIKLVVEEYYDEGQDNCNTNGSMGSGSANFQMRWTFMN